MQDQPLRFEQIHIDVARNSTDDFNPFHDPMRWRNIRRNPFGSTIALGFQMAFLASDRIQRYREQQGEAAHIRGQGLHFSNYEFLFAGALQAGEEFTLEVKKTVDTNAGNGGVSNRSAIRRFGGELILLGTQSETRTPRFLDQAVLQGLPSLQHLPDRAKVPGTPFFLKRKFLNTSNAKNFTLGALCDQFQYFDELSERICFPPLFTTALLSCALLEKGWSEGYDFEADPLVYTSHQISVDRRIQRQLRSNDVLHLLIEGPLPLPAHKGLGRSAVEQQSYHCYGLLHGNQVLLRGQLQLAPLHAFLAAEI